MRQNTNQIFIDGTGYSSALIINRIFDLYAVACQDPFCAQLARSHANTNILCLGSEIIGPSLAKEIVNKNPDANVAGKRLLETAWHSSAGDGLKLEETLQKTLITSPNQVEAV